MLAIFKAVSTIKTLTSLAALLGLAWFCYDYGRDSNEKKWQEREKATQRKILQYHDEQRAQESLYNVLLGNIRDELEELRNGIYSDQSDNNQLASSIASLRFKYNKYKANRTETSIITAPSKECDGETITYFSGEVFEAISNDFARCDAIVNQLSACQRLLIADRQICGTTSGISR